MAPDPRAVILVSLLTVAGGLLAGITLLRRRHSTDLAEPLAIWAFGVTVWAFSEGGLSYLTILPAGLQRAGQYGFLIGGALVIVGGSRYVLALAGRGDLDTLRLRLVIGGPPVVVALLGALDSRWHLGYRSLTRGPDQMWQYEPGPLFSVALAWGLAVLTAVSLGLVTSVMQSLDERRGWTLMAASALFVPALVLVLGSSLPQWQWAGAFASPALAVTLLLWWFVERHSEERGMVPVSAAHVLRQVSDAVAVVDPDGRVLETNPASRALLLRPEENARSPLGKPWRHIADPALVDVLDGGPSLTRTLAGGQVVQVRTTPLVESGITLGTIIAARDITELDRLRHELAEQATRDFLTGLHNRRNLDGRLADLVEHATMHGKPLSVVMIDVDEFKDVNDRHGHAVGDAVIVAVARQVLASARSSDELVRIGGDEFLVLLPGLTAPEAHERAEELRARAAGLHSEGGAPVTVTLSIGVAQLQPGMDVEALLKSADRALYRAKAEGRDTVCVA